MDKGAAGWDIVPRRLIETVCRQHPWFTLHLPRYLAVMQADTIANTAMLDEDIVHEVVKLGFKRSDVVKSIQKRSQNKVWALALTDCNMTSSAT